MADDNHEPLNVIPPARIAQLVEEVGVAKVHLPVDRMATLAVLAGAFIALGALYYTITVTGSTLGFGPTRTLGGVGFSLGLILVVIGGAELFTGNALIVMAWADRKVTLAALLRNWTIVYAGNFAGAVGTAFLVYWAGLLDLSGGAVGETQAAIVAAKLALEPFEAFARGILCNVLVCLAIWLCFAARSVIGKAVAIVFPISAFVAAGMEHSVANMFFLPLAMLAGTPEVTIAAIAANLVPVTLGNIVGGGILVALVYWLVYLRRP